MTPGSGPHPSSAARVAAADRSVALTGLKTPWNAPSGVRCAATITTAIWLIDQLFRHEFMGTVYLICYASKSGSSRISRIRCRDNSARSREFPKAGSPDSIGFKTSILR